eukprot:CAMPEP_0170508766 /NCGR_PEP_ID=MMETSP0208-20121228/63364_1 /TAXON_ID=197538 /ORGANISM="Strombidium inclinatum, Strain S3" /LENGTH=55 /DNA_ID=CAMNT_0010791853 /DNA_START=107 /DNA_END=271 /DNA_ORIENTATION=+
MGSAARRSRPRIRRSSRFMEATQDQDPAQLLSKLLTKPGIVLILELLASVAQEPW